MTSLVPAIPCQAAPKGNPPQGLADADRPKSILIVDLDGTLVKTDMLFETAWSASAADWKVLVQILCLLTKGRAALKRFLAARADVDPATLPYNTAVLRRIEAWRAAGGRTALVSASDQNVLDAIAGHLGLFDEAFGSDGLVNLKGERKAAFLVERYGERGFVYAGDSTADLAVWRHAKGAIAVTPSRRLRHKVARLLPDAESLDTDGVRPRDYLRALRPHQWVKNALVFAPMLAAHRLDSLALVQSLLAFVAFCLVASAVYVLNDLLDLASDRAHPRKRTRPCASGAVPLSHASAMIPLLLAASFAVGALSGPALPAVLAGYLVLTLAYCFSLKRRALVDMVVLAGLYTGRLVGGAAATDIPLSVWILAFSLFLFLSLAALKRQGELIDAARRGELKPAGRGYTRADLPMVAVIAAAAGYMSVSVVALYVSAPTVRVLYTQPYILWGLCPVLLYWITHMLLATHRGRMHDDPVVFALRDPTSHICGVLAAGLVVCAAVM